ncbi:VWA domain-containing protein [Saccharospirillum impatiens]|uniref:VWA domain-containing protein n=1 Tax=Saccharospirillum impatiens TaxID=169438 RepID=UPI00040A0E4B|nr:VWA domain-containing protein [Saccharospirillum impatiens]
MIWTRPLLLLALLPWLVWAVWRWRRQQRQGAWHRLMDDRLLRRLNYQNSARRQSWSQGALLLAGVLLIVAAAGPARPLSGGTTLTAGNLIVVLDATLSMTVEDTPPSRAVRAERLVQDWAASGVFERTAVVVYSGSAHWLVPLTRDIETLALQLEQMTPYIMPQFGNRPELAFERVTERLESLQGRSQLLWITDDASPGRMDALLAARPPVERFWLMPMGTESGGPIPLPDGSGYLQDGSRMVMPTLNRAGFRDVAARLDATLLPMEQPVTTLDLSIDRGEVSRERQLREWGFWLLLPALLLLLPWYRRGLVYCLPLGLLWQPMPAEAASWSDPLLKNREQRAFQAYQEGDADRSLALTERPELSAQLAFEQGDFERAEELWQQLDNATAHYNRGNALAHQGSLQEAIDAYDEALARADLEAARHNRDRVAEALEQQQEQQQQQQEQQQDSQSEYEQSGDSDSQPAQSQDSNPQPGGEPDDQREPQPQDDESPGQNDGEEDRDAEPVESDDARSRGEPDPDLDARRRDQAVEQLLNRVPSAEGQVLQRKFQYQFQQAPTDEEPDSLW